MRGRTCDFIRQFSALCARLFFIDLPEAASQMLGEKGWS
jgi:hypothetical protein